MEASRSSASVSIVVPTLNERDNVQPLVERTFQSVASLHRAVEMIFVDDGSRDGTLDEVGALQDRYPIRAILRESRPRCLSSSVLLGIQFSQGEHIVVMDADLSHPPECIPSLLAALDGGAEFAMSSRNLPGASIDEHWGWFRWLNARVAGLLALPLTKVSDPCAGFFAFPRRILGRAHSLDPVGYKIGLELLVKCAVRRIVEVPIRFAQRRAGHSKLSLREQLRYLEHLRRLYGFRLRSAWQRSKRRRDPKESILLPAPSSRLPHRPLSPSAGRTAMEEAPRAAQRERLGT